MFTVYDSSGEAVYTIEQDKEVLVSFEAVSSNASEDSQIDYTSYFKEISNNTYNIAMGLLLFFTLIVIFREFRWWR